jgi:hypothetical protein
MGDTQTDGQTQMDTERESKVILEASKVREDKQTEGQTQADRKVIP